MSNSRAKVLTTRKRPSVPDTEVAGWVPLSVQTLTRKRTLVHLLRIEPQLLDHQAHSPLRTNKIPGHRRSRISSASQNMSIVGSSLVRDIKSRFKCVFSALVLSFFSSRRLATNRRLVQGFYQMSTKKKVIHKCGDWKAVQIVIQLRSAFQKDVYRPINAM